MTRPFRRTVAFEDYLDDAASLAAYSYDASGKEARPSLVLRPRNEEQLRRILVLANQHRVAVVPRGSATGTRGGATGDGVLLLDMRGFDRITRLDPQLATVDVEAGVTFSQLQERLAPHGFRFPLAVANGEATLGGLAAINHVTEESLGYGDLLERTVQAELFDGLGRFQTLKGDDLRKVLGWEGTTGILVRLRLKVAPTPTRRTLDIHEVASPTEALHHAALAAAKHPFLTEYVDAQCASLLGLAAKPHVIIGYEGDVGAYKDQVKVEELLAARKRLGHRLWGEGFPIEEEATLEEEQVERFVARCESAGWPCYGHLAIGVLSASLRDEKERERFLNGVVSIGATPGGKWGYGRVKRPYAPTEMKRLLVRLKEERDYNLILNPGVLS